MPDRTCDVAVVGCGIVGLATAMELQARFPALRLVMLEKEDGIARHQSGHNSGVIHSGIYYTPGSLKARLCVEGGRRLRAFCDARGIPYELCGKVIVATEEEELPRLEELYRRGTANGVPGVEIIGPERLREIEPHAAGIKAVYSPQTGVIDFPRVATAYAEEVRTKGGEILTGHEVTGVRRRADGAYVETTGGTVHCRYLVTCAGLHSDRVAEMTGTPPTLRIVPFRGDYYVLRPERRYLVRTLIYPVPDPALPFLGVHLSKRFDGEIWAGPNAVLAFAKEGYRRLDVSLADEWRTLTYHGFWAMARQYWRIGVSELYRDFSKAAFLRSCQRYVPALEWDDLQPGPSGVRAQAVSIDGRLVDDFAVYHDGNVVHVRNAPSPAATSSLALGAEIVDMLERYFGFTRATSAAAT